MTAAEIVTAGNLVDLLTALTVDELRALEGRLEDAHRITRAVLRERLQLQRRDAGWRARLAVAGPEDGAAV